MTPHPEVIRAVEEIIPDPDEAHERDRVASIVQRCVDAVCAKPGPAASHPRMVLVCYEFETGKGREAADAFVAVTELTSATLQNVRRGIGLEMAKGGRVTRGAIVFRSLTVLDDALALNGTPLPSGLPRSS